MSGQFSKKEALEIARKIRYDLTGAQGKLTAIINAIEALEVEEPEPAICPHCFARLRGPITLSEHLYVSHDGPEPEHWKDPPATIEPGDPEAEAAA